MGLKSLNLRKWKRKKVDREREIERLTIRKWQDVKESK